MRIWDALQPSTEPQLYVDITNCDIKGGAVVGANFPRFSPNTAPYWLSCKALFSGGRVLSRSRKLFVIEECIERGVGLPLVFRFQPLIDLAQLAALNIFLDLPIPFAVSLFLEPLLQFDQLPGGESADGRFDFLQCRHAYRLTTTGPRWQERGKLFNSPA
jgi:hypothetical protein